MDQRDESQKQKPTTNGESDLMNAFKMAANSVAMLYKEGLRNTNNSYQMGYEQALQDVWQFASLHSDLNYNISKSDLVKFLQEKHSESLNGIDIQKDAVAANLESSNSVTNASPKSGNSIEHHSFSFTTNPPAIPSFNPSLPNDLPQLPEPVTHGYDSLKRRWAYQSTSGNENQSISSQAYNMQIQDQSSKRLRRDDDPM
jgi:hypothetical protein